MNRRRCQRSVHELLDGLLSMEADDGARGPIAGTEDLDGIAILADLT